MKSGDTSKSKSQKTETSISEVKQTKMSLATDLYTKLLKDDPHIPRKDIIEEFVNQCGLTPAGAATYYNTIKKRISVKTN
jgi:hypothetical protein